MATVRPKQPCVKCDKGPGIAMCGGCEKWFCRKHFMEHRDSLGEEMDRVGQQHDLLHKQLAEDNVMHAFHLRINKWESSSINKIRQVAEKARTDLEKYLNNTKTELKNSLGKIRVELATSRESDDYTETDLTNWIENLNKMRQLLEKPSSIDILENDQSLPLICVGSLKSSGKFGNVSSADIRIEENGCVAVCQPNCSTWPEVRGTQLYSSGVHQIQIKMEQLVHGMFGITSSSTPIQNIAFAAKSSCFWYAGNNDVRLYGSSHKDYGGYDGNIRVGHTVELRINCNERKIALFNKTTSKLYEISVDINNCPFPWVLSISIAGATRLRII
ncbi:unnamed protein product [Rotaria magnacalcarata]|uniref:B box-type domain-containing protein n=1 Tax=Rotaria magnacalcarata TaxID=392030 RepID=A0A815YEZ2_9BILA|nr:unnamed protein product [Rotaria magnacalcarata]CAF1591859.1 unnamed protein product [Rotaria magnacalcarata]CAF2068647.1 unnamed protein product [Rotaria magnacalcarata]